MLRSPTQPDAKTFGVERGRCSRPIKCSCMGQRRIIEAAREGKNILEDFTVL